MAKSKVMAVSVGTWEGHGVEVTFYRYDRSPEQRAMGFTDWMQSHRKLTRASGQRVERIVRGGDVIIWPGILAVTVETDEEFWNGVRQYWAEAEAMGDMTRVVSYQMFSSRNALVDQLNAKNEELTRQLGDAIKALEGMTQRFWLGESRQDGDVELALQVLINSGRLVREGPGRLRFRTEEEDKVS